MSTNISMLRAEVQELERDLARLETRTTAIESRFLSLLSLTRRLSGSESLDDLIDFMLRVYSIGMALLALLQAIQVARLAAGDPTAWLGLIVAGGTLAVSVGAYMEMASPQY